MRELKARSKLETSTKRKKHKEVHTALRMHLQRIGAKKMRRYMGGGLIFHLALADSEQNA